MPEFAIAIHHSPEFGQILRLGITSALPGTAVHEARNLEDGWNLLQRHGVESCRIVVSGLRVPRSASSEVPALDGSERTSLDLVRRIRELGVEKLPVLLVAAENSSSEDLGEFKNVNVACVTDIALRAPELIRAMLGMEARRREWRNVDLDIELHKDGCRWQLRRMAPFQHSHGALDIRGHDIERLRGYSKGVNFRALEDAEYLSTLGKDVFKVVMGADADGHTLRSRLEQLCDTKVGIQGARIRFIVDQHTHPILVESLKESSHGDDKDFWMLRTPLFRSWQGKTERPPLFSDGESRSKPLSCLLIQGLTGAFRSWRLERDFNSTEQAAEEVSELAEYLRSRGRGPVKVLRYDPADAKAGADFAAKVRAELEKHDWDLVHYAGHSLATKNQSGTYTQGYVVFGGEDEDVVPADEFARWLAKSRFVFLSSCESAGADFVLQLVERTVPAIVGFRWPIADSPAKFFAKNFYTYLLKDEKDRHLEYAFFKAKRALHEKYPVGQPVWASPVLVMQNEPPRS